MSQTLTEEWVIKSTRLWVETVVVGLNFCPFAKPEVEGNAVRYMVLHEGSIAACLTGLIEACQQLIDSDEIETCLIIYPLGFASFDAYLELVDIAETLLVEQGYEGVLQLASFHPDYCFEALQPDDPANYTNRSPYPMLHILREASVARVLKEVAEPEQIPKRNIELARRKGLSVMQAMLSACKMP